MMKTEEYIALEDQYGAHNYHPLDVVIDRGEGVWVWDVEGKKYLDCLSAYSALNQGHVHPKLVDALTKQAQKVTLTSRAFRNVQLPLLYKQISEISGYDMALLMNSGAEAVETAVKLARKWAYQVKKVPQNEAEIIVAVGNFHGRTTTIISFSTEPSYKQDFGPFTPGFVAVPYGDADAFEAAITPNTAAILIEPLQGENGVIIPPDGYLPKLKALCEEHQILFMADEIQTGLGRTGKMFACDHQGVRPDVVVIGKALSGGFYPVSAVLADKELMSLFRPGQHGSTFGGNPLGAAVSRAALEIIVEENLVENSARMGEYFMDQLEEINSPHIQEVRGQGLLIGVELKQAAGGARRFCEALMHEGILCKETHDHVIRFAPPLIIKSAEIDWAMPKIRAVLTMK
jgi:ornithine--oxo-acid transaminase